MAFWFLDEAMILIAVSPIAYYEGPQALLMVISYLSAVTLVKARGTTDIAV